MDNKLAVAIKKRDFVMSKFNDIDQNLNKDKTLKEYYLLHQNEFLENDINFELLEAIYNKRQENINKKDKKDTKVNIKEESEVMTKINSTLDFIDDILYMFK